MARLLIVYGTTEGHTRDLAGEIARTVRGHGHAADVIEASLRPSPAGHDGVIVAASVHQLRHQESVTRFIHDHVHLLGTMPTAFFSVSLNAALPDAEHQEAAWECVEGLIAETGWRPGAAFLVAGALRYSRYGVFKRWMMRRFARRYTGDTDGSRDHEYTDRHKLRRDAESFLALLPADAAAAAAEEPLAVILPASAFAGSASVVPPLPAAMAPPGLGCMPRIRLPPRHGASAHRAASGRSPAV
jgi:menaquinone-dependent protoporphyrinogen oxidase